MPYTLMRIGSTSKVQTFVAAYVLIQQGVVSLSGTIFGQGGILDYMSNAPKPLQSLTIDDITIEHLLSHQ